MVAWGDKDRHGDMAETSDKLLPGFKKGAVAVKQVAGQKNDVRALTHRKLRKSAEQNSLLASADGGFPGAQALKGRVHVQICRVQDSDFSHKLLR